VAIFLFCLPPLTWTATGLLAGWLAARRGKSWLWGFALGFFCSTAGVVLAALPRMGGPAPSRHGEKSCPRQGHGDLQRREEVDPLDIPRCVA
jgi:hypothetical protein